LHYTTLKLLYSQTTDHGNEYWMFEGEIPLTWTKSYSFSTDHDNEYWKREYKYLLQQCLATFSKSVIQKSEIKLKHNFRSETFLSMQT